MKEFIKKTVFTAIAASLANIIFVLVFNLFGCTDNFFETFSPGYFFPILSLVFVILHMTGCIILRRKKLKNILKGIFLYQIIGVICFIFYLIILMLDVNNLLDIPANSFLCSIPHYIFSWWVICLEPLSTIIARFLGVWNTLTVAILWFVLVYFTGNSILGIKKDKDLEQKIKDRHLADNK